MRKGSVTLAFLMVVGVLAASPALAAGPVDGEASLVWWMSDGSVFGEGGPEIDEGGVGGTASIWVFDRWGARAGLYQAEFASGGEVEYGSLDVLAKVFAPSRNNYVAVGLGWEDISLSPVAETNGLRLVAEGRVGLFGIVHGYGQAAYLPSMDDFPGASNVDGMEYDVGITVEPGPLVSFRAGYRATTVDFEDTVIIPGQTISSEAKGYHFGVGLHF